MRLDVTSSNVEVFLFRNAKGTGYDTAPLVFCGYDGTEEQGNGHLSDFVELSLRALFAAVPETGLDYFGARYYSGAQVRFTSPDWSDTPQPVPYADLNDPQTLNLYSYVRNNPLSRPDVDGHCGTTFLQCTVTIASWAAPRLAALTSAGTAAATGLVAFGAAVISYRGNHAISSGSTFGIASDGGTTQVLLTEQGRDDKGKFVSPKPGDSRPGSNAEAEADKIIEPEGHQVLGNNVPVTNESGGRRTYDTVYTDKGTGATVGVETKGGRASKTPQQKAFDQGVTPQTPAAAGPKGQRLGIDKIDQVRDIRIP